MLSGRVTKPAAIAGELCHLVAMKACFHKQTNEKARRCEAAQGVWVRPMRKGSVILEKQRYDKSQSDIIFKQGKYYALHRDIDQ